MIQTAKLNFTLQTDTEQGRRVRGGGGGVSFGFDFFFLVLVREVGNVRWVPLLRVWKIDPNILSLEEKKWRSPPQKKKLGLEKINDGVPHPPHQLFQAWRGIDRAWHACNVTPPPPRKKNLVCATGNKVYAYSAPEFVIIRKIWVLANNSVGWEPEGVNSCRLSTISNALLVLNGVTLTPF